MREIWKDIEEFKGLYQVSNLGNVRSVERFINTRIYPSQLMRKYPHKVGKEVRGERVHLRSPYKAGQLQRSVAKLVLQAFNGNPPKNAKQVIHIDGNPLNNKLDNLKWDVNSSFYMPENKEAKELFNKYIMGVIKMVLYKNCKPFVEYRKNDIEDDIQELAIKIYDVINALRFDKDKDFDSKKRHFYCFCRYKIIQQVKRILKKELNKQKVYTFSEYNAIVGEDYDIESSIGSEDVYNFENEVDMQEFCSKYNITEKVFKKAYAKVF